MRRRIVYVLKIVVKFNVKLFKIFFLSILYSDKNRRDIWKPVTFNVSK